MVVWLRDGLSLFPLLGKEKGDSHNSEKVFIMVSDRHTRWLVWVCAPEVSTGDLAVGGLRSGPWRSKDFLGGEDVG